MKQIKFSNDLCTKEIDNNIYLEHWDALIHIGNLEQVRLFANFLLASIKAVEENEIE